MRIASAGQIDDLYISYSPFLSTLAQTGVGVDMTDDGAIIIDNSMSVINEYLSFLRGDEFSVNEEVASFFEFMGHVNEMEYPIDFWKIKLQDNWIRDNFYKLRLVDDQYYGLVPIPVVRSLNIDLPDGVFIAGGAAMYMAGYIGQLRDIDMFTTNKDAAIEWMGRIFEDLRHRDHVIEGNLRRWNRLIGDKAFQLIKRVYQSPSEIVHGFDLDCVGVIWDGTNLYATRRAIWSNENKVNWFDPGRMSPSYIYRLTKYMRRGYDLKVPFYDLLELDVHEANRVWVSMRDTSITMCEHDVPHALPKPISDVGTYSELMGNQFIISKYERMLTYMMGIKYYHKMAGIPLDGEPYHLEGDLPTILALAVHYGLVISLAPSLGDYDATRINVDPPRVEIEHPREPKAWMTIDPMQQLTGTFNPASIGGAQELISWLRSTPLIN